MSGKENIGPVTYLQIPTIEIMALKVTKQERNTPLSLQSEFCNDIEESKWKDLPMELLLRILKTIDERTLVRAADVCTSWRLAICFGVQELSLSWCNQNINELLQFIAPKFRCLQSLNPPAHLRQLNDQSVAVMARYCHDLRTLDLSNSNQLTDTAVESLAYGCSKLEKVYLCGCTRLTDASVKALAHGCNKLEKLYISGCTGFTDSAIIALAINCNRLKQLNLCGCVKAATDRSLQALAQYCHGLETLNLGWCERVTDVGITCLANGCPELRAVDLCGCVLITDQSVKALAENCHQLRILGLYYCRNITDDAMYSLVNSNICGAVKGNARHNIADHYHNDFASHHVQQFSQNLGSQGTCNKSGERRAVSRDYMESVLSEHNGDGLLQLNVSQCTSLSAHAVQAVCDTFPGLHTCPERHSLIKSGCLNLNTVKCVCADEARRGRRNRAAEGVLHMIR